MTLTPEVQRKARVELDAVVGPTRLPTVADRENLPYIEAIIKETLRWHNPAPILIPHVNTADDNYDGFFIPANSVVVVNAWSVPVLLMSVVADHLCGQVNHARPADVPRPRAVHSRAVPEEWEDRSKCQRSPECHIRIWPPVSTSVLATRYRTRRSSLTMSGRICPGRHFADASLFIYIASILHTLDISPPLNETGQPIHIVPQTTTSITSCVIYASLLHRTNAHAQAYRGL